MAALELKDFDLYVNGFVIEFPEGDKMLVREHIVYDVQIPDVYHTVQQGDTLTYIAWLHYFKYVGEDAPKYWRYIADINKIHNPLDLSDFFGEDLIIPDFNLCKLSE